MKELRFHRQVYRGEAVDESVKTFGRFADFELSEEPDYWVVKLTAKDAARERRIAGELANFALGLTIEQEGAR